MKRVLVVSLMALVIGVWPRTYVVRACEGTVDPTTGEPCATTRIVSTQPCGAMGQPW